MPVLERTIRNVFTIARTAPSFSGTTGQIDMTSSLTRGGKKIDEAGSLRVAAVWIANSVLADEVASLTGKLIERGDKTRTPLRPPALRALWSDNPNPDQTRFGVEATETLSMNLWGASYTMLGWTIAGELDVRWPIDPSHVTLGRSERGGLRLRSPHGELVNEPGERPQFEFCPRYTLPGQLTPVSPVRLAAELAGLSLAYEDLSAKLIGRGFNPAALLTFGEYVETKTAEEVSGRLMRLHGGDKAGGVAVIGGPDAKLERLTMSMADAQALEQYDQIFKILLAIWRVPPTVAGMVDKPSTWGTGIAEFSRGLERFTLRPIVQQRQASKEKHITQWVNPDIQVKYPFDSLLSASPKERTEIQARRLQVGATSIERVLAQEDEPPFDEAETVYSPLALALDEDRRLERLRAQAEAYGSLIRAGATPDAAAEATGFDPAALTHTGLRPVTVQAEDE